MSDNVLRLIKSSQKSLNYEELLEILAQKDSRIRKLEEEIKNLSDRLSEREQKLDEAMKNSVTGLYCDRVFMQSQIMQMLNHARHNGFNVLVAYIDLDNLKQINDCFGHDVGDEAIMLCSISVRSCMRLSDQLYHRGGDEFLLFALFKKEDCAEGLEAAAEAFTQRIKQGVKENPLIISNCLKYSMSISMGYCFIEGCSEKSVEESIRRADFLMYLDKEKNKKGR